MAKMVYDEWYGELTYKQRAAYKKYNVSPSDHDDLVSKFGRDNHDEIVAAVLRSVEKNNGMFSSYNLS